MIPSNRCVEFLFIVATLLGSERALAMGKPEHAAAAEALFQSATKLVDAGDYAAGCPKFEASFALYPSASTMLNIARCHEHEGKWATALENYQYALVLNRETHGEQRRKALEGIAIQGIEALQSRVPTVRIVMENVPDRLKLSRNGQDVPLAALGDALPTNPGQVTIRASAPGYRSKELSVFAHEGETTTVELALQPLPPGTPTWVWVTGSAGILLAGTALAFAVDNMAAVQALRENCRDIGGQTYCAAGYDYQRDNTRKNRDMGLFVGLGGASVIAIGSAVAGFVHAHSSKRDEKPPMHATIRPWVGPNGMGIMMRGNF